MLNPNAKVALRRMAASLLGMGQTRLALAGVELVQARQNAVKAVLWVVLGSLAVVFASLFVCALVIALAWDTHRFVAIAGCAAFYGLLAAWCCVQFKSTVAAQPDLFEATIAELGRDKDALLASLSADQATRGHHE